MKNLLRVLTGTVVMLIFSLGANAGGPLKLTGKSNIFTFDTTSTAVPLSWPAMGIAVLLILGFIIGYHILSEKKYGVVKRIVPFFLLVFFVGSFFAFARLAPEVNVDVKDSERGSGRTTIDINVPDRRVGSIQHEISAKVSFDGGVIWEDDPIPNVHLKLDGQIYDDDPIIVTFPGDGTLIWDGGATYPDKKSKNTKIKIIATPQFD